MATKNITTWAEFVDALTETITEDTTYEIQNDIDVSDTVIENAYILLEGGAIKTFNGNGHKINGITSYVNNHDRYGLFYWFSETSTSKVDFNNLRFENIMMPNYRLMYFNQTPKGKFTNCYFNGLMYGFSDSKGTFYNSSFNVEISMFGVSNASNCYFKIKNYDETISLYGNISFGNLRDCYVVTDFKALARTDSSVRLFNFIYSYDCVFNIHYKITNYSSSRSYSWISGSSPSTLCLINKEFITDGTGSIIIDMNDETNLKGLTDEQLKSKTYIQNNTNFPLYG